MSFVAQSPSQMLSVAGTSGGVAIPVSSGQHMRIVNTSTTLWVGVAFGPAAATAAFATAGSPSSTVVIGPNQTNVIDIPPGSAYVAMIGSGAGPTAVHCSIGKES